MQPTPRKRSFLDIIIVVLIIVVIAAALYYFFIFPRSSETTDQESSQKPTSEELMEQRGTYVEVPIEQTQPRPTDPATGEYLVSPESGETVEVFVPNLPDVQ